MRPEKSRGGQARELPSAASHACRFHVEVNDEIHVQCAESGTGVFRRIGGQDPVVVEFSALFSAQQVKRAREFGPGRSHGLDDSEVAALDGVARKLGLDCSDGEQRCAVEAKEQAEGIVLRGIDECCRAFDGMESVAGSRRVAPVHVGSFGRRSLQTVCGPPEARGRKRQG